MKPTFATKVSFITVCKRWVVSTRSNILPSSALRKPARSYSQSRSRSHKHTERQMWENSLFSQASWHFTPISSKFCIICCYYVCFGLLMQISLADYSAYLHELRVRCTLWSIIRSISGWFLNSKSLFSNSVPPLNVNKFIENCINWQYTRCWSACKQGVARCVYPPDVKYPDVHFASRWNTTQSCRSIEIPVYTRNYYRRLRTYHIWSNL